MASRVRRFDALPISSPERLADGRLRVPGYIARSGIQMYRDADGKTRREYRPPDEVFHADAVASFEDVPLTNNHPPKLISAKDARKYMVGHVSRPTRDGERLGAVMIVNDEDTITDIEGGKRQLSGGYTCDYDPTPGVTPAGERYDGVQRNIRGNHVAIVDKGRAGPDVALRMDGDAWVDDGETADGDLTAAVRGNLADAKFAVPERSVLPIENADHVKAAMSRFGQTHFTDADEKKTAYGRIVRRANDLGVDCAGFKSAWSGRLDTADHTDTKEPPVKIKINGVEYDVTEQVAQAIAKMDSDHQATVAKLTAEHTAAVTTVTGERDKQAARADVAEENLAKEKKLRTDAEDPKAFRERLAVRVALETTARKFLGDAKLDDLTDMQVQAEVLKKLKPDLKLDGKGDVYIAARFDAAVEDAPTATDKLRVVVDHAGTITGTDEKAARARMIEANQKASLNNKAKE